METTIQDDDVSLAFSKSLAIFKPYLTLKNKANTKKHHPRMFNISDIFIIFFYKVN